jgi:hypothetical protein
VRLHTIECAGEFKTSEAALEELKDALQRATPEDHRLHVTGLIASEQEDGTWTVTLRANSFPGHAPSVKASIDESVFPIQPHAHESHH